MRTSNIIGWLFTFYLFFSFQLINAGEIVSLQSGAPNSSDILKAFQGSDDNEADILEDLPEGLLEGLGDGVSEKRFKGLSVKGLDSNSYTASTSCPKNTNTIALNINFKLNSAEIDSNNLRLVHEFAKAVNNPKLAGCRFVIEGHTDASGDAKYNLQLSEKRALEVKIYLANANVKFERMDVLGKGEISPLNKNNLNDAKNRRVQFRILQ